MLAQGCENHGSGSLRAPGKATLRGSWAVLYYGGARSWAELLHHEEREAAWPLGQSVQ